MKKSDVIEGKHYVQASSKDFISYGYGNTRVVVVSNDDHIEVSMYRRRLSDRLLREDEDYTKAHLAFSLCEAFEKDCTPNEKHAAKLLLNDAEQAAVRGYFAANPMRCFEKRSSKFDTTGALCRRVDDDGVVIDGQYLRERYPDSDSAHMQQSITRDGLFIVPRRELRMEWRDYVAARKQSEDAKAEAARRRKEYEQQKANEREQLVQTLVALGYEGTSYGVFKGEGLPQVIVPTYGGKVELDVATLDALLGAATKRGQEG